MHIKVTRSRRNRHHTILREREPPTLFFLPPSILFLGSFPATLFLLFIKRILTREKKKLY